MSPSTIFRLFEDLDGMHSEAFSVRTERVEHLLVTIPETGTLEDRLHQLVLARARLYEEVAPVLRFQARSVASFGGARSNRDVGNACVREEVATTFATELADGPAGTLESVDALTSWEIWERLRSAQGLSVTKARSTLEGMVLSILRSHLT